MNRADRIDILFKDEKDYNDFLDDHYDREHVAGMGYDIANNMWRAQTDKSTYVEVDGLIETLQSTMIFVANQPNSLSKVNQYQHDIEDLIQVLREGRH